MKPDILFHLPTVLKSYSPKVLFVLLIILQSYSLTVSAQPLQFYREDIVFRLDQNNMETDAIYRFCNVGEKDIITPLFYPFPGNTMELIDSIVVMNVKNNEIIPYRNSGSGILFEISVPSYGQSSYRVYFRQKLVENKFTYILTSTETWNRPLEFANFELQVQEGITVDSLSFAPDSSFIKEKIDYFIWRKKDFMPVADFEVIFH